MISTRQNSSSTLFRFRLLGVCLLTIAMSSFSRAAITIDISDATVFEGTDSAVLDVLIRSDSGGDLPAAIISDFIVENAEFLNPPGEFDQPGFFNEGNFVGPPASDLIRDSNNLGLAFASFEFENPAAVPTNDVVLARLFVNSAALATGQYDLQIDGLLILDGSANEIASTGLGGTLSVVAIPEASSVAFLGALGCISFARRRRRS